MTSIVTLTTDFGSRDPYVAAMKGTILGIHPEVRMVDVSHEIASQDIMEAAFVLKGVVPFFPPGTIHLVVVDPGVGTVRRPVAARFQEQVFVGPDNGIFSLILDEKLPDELVVLDRRKYWRSEAPSNTFHGRDIFAPVAAHLAAGRSLEEVGTATETPLVRLRWALPISDEQGIRGWVVHVDRFGNCITNITEEQFESQRLGRDIKTYAGTSILKGVQSTYGDVAQGEPLVLIGSRGFLEIAVNGGNASELLSIRKGAPVNIVFADKKQNEQII